MTSITLTDRNECPLCGSHDTVVFIPFPEIPVVRCCKCSFTYSSKVLSGQDVTAYYENNFGSQRHMQGQLVNSMVNSWVLTRLINIQDISNILDVGTGYGFLLKALCKRYEINGAGCEQIVHVLNVAL